MKQNIIPAIRLTLVCMLFFMGFYSLLILAGAQLVPGKGKGETVVVNNRVVGWKLLGQKFTDDTYFGGRPSAVDYNAAGSAGSNKGPSNLEYLTLVKARSNFGARDRASAHAHRASTSSTSSRATY